jgi:outer membrane protein assembly factor BamD
MFVNRIYIIFIILGLTALTFSCSQYEKVVKSDDVNLKYSKAFYYYKRGEFVKAGTLFDQLAPMTRGTRRADSVYFYRALLCQFCSNVWEQLIH